MSHSSQPFKDASAQWLLDNVAPIINTHLQTILNFAQERYPQDDSRLLHNFPTCNALTPIQRFNGNGLNSLIAFYGRAKNTSHPAQLSHCVLKVMDKIRDYLKINNLERSSLIRYEDDVGAAMKRAKESGHQNLVHILQGLSEESLDMVYNAPTIKR